MSKSQLRLIQLHPATRRNLAFSNKWKQTRDKRVEPKHTYETTMYGQLVTVQVLPSAMEASPDEWDLFTAIPKNKWVLAERTPAERRESKWSIWEYMSERVFLREMNVPWRRKK